MPPITLVDLEFREYEGGETDGRRTARRLRYTLLYCKPRNDYQRPQLIVPSCFSQKQLSFFFFSVFSSSSFCNRQTLNCRLFNIIKLDFQSLLIQGVCLVGEFHAVIQGSKLFPLGFATLESSSYFCSVDKLCLTLCNSMDCSTPGFPILPYLLEFAQTHVH